MSDVDARIPVFPERDRALSEGFTRYLTKPVNRSELLSVLSELTRRQ